jgi:hypothetical protein
MSKLTKIEINGVDVSSFLVNYEYEETSGDIIGQIEAKFGC